MLPRKPLLFAPATLLSFLTDSLTSRPKSTTFDNTHLPHEFVNQRSTSCDPILTEDSCVFGDGKGDSFMPVSELENLLKLKHSDKSFISKPNDNDGSILFPSTEVLFSSSPSPTVLSAATDLFSIAPLEPVVVTHEMATQFSPAENLTTEEKEEEVEDEEEKNIGRVNVLIKIKKDTTVKSLLRTIPVYSSRGKVKRRFVVRDPDRITSLWGVRLGKNGESVLQDRRLIIALNRYPGSVAELVAREREFRKLNKTGLVGTPKFFLYLQTTSWDQMRWLVRDLERDYPEWGLARQLTR